MTEIVHVQNRNGSISTSSDSTDSSIGDFENDVIRDELETMDSRMDDLRSNQLTRAAEETRIDRVELQNSSGIVIGNQTFIEGPVIFDRRVPSEGDSAFKKEEHSKEIEKETSKKPLRRWRNIVKLVTISLVVTLLAICAVLLISYFINSRPGSSTEHPMSSTTTPSTTITTTPIPLTYTLVSRAEWGATPYPYTPKSMVHPVKSIIITETGTDECSTNETCIKIVRLAQEKNLEITGPFSYSIGNSFLVADFNAIYEGSGWNASGTLHHSRPVRSYWYVIAFIGTFVYKKPTEEQINAYLALIEEGVRDKYIDENYEMFADCQHFTSHLPDTALTKMIKDWPHWNNGTWY